MLEDSKAGVSGCDQVDAATDWQCGEWASVIEVDIGQDRESGDSVLTLQDLLEEVTGHATGPESATLTDILVHGQDIAIPIGRSLDSDPEAAALAGSRIWSRAFMFHAQRRLRGLRLIATDTDWTVGAGDEVAGRMIDLLLLLTGRSATCHTSTGSARSVSRTTEVT